MRSNRFGKDVVVTAHARARMIEREIGDVVLLEVVETGELRDQGDGHLFIFKQLAGRHDNLVCAAAVEEEVLVIKTVMVNWTLREET